MNTGVSPAKNLFAGIVAAFFVLGLGYSAYNYFKTAAPRTEGENLLDEASNMGSSSTVREDEENSGINNPEDVIGNVEKIHFFENIWRANDYVEGDISSGDYVVLEGDTLWEIAEGAYGDSSQWTRLLENNADTVGLLQNGEQALIFPGQILQIP